MSTASPRARVSTRRRAFERIALGSGLLSLLVAAMTGTFAVAQDDGQGATRPAIWNSSSAAGAVNVVFNSDPPMLPAFEEFINFIVSYGKSAWSSGGSSTAVAGSVYPGSTGTRGPGLLCDFSGGGCPPGFPPPYPLFTEAAYPSNPDTASPAGDSRAHAGRDYSEASAGVSTLLAPALGPLVDVVDVGLADSSARQEFGGEDGATIISTAEAHLRDIKLLGGVIQIESIDVISVSTSRGRGDTTETNTTTVEGVTVAGTPATLTNRGLNIAGSGSGEAERQQFEDELNAALEAFGASIRLVGASGDAGEHAASGSARGVEIAFDVPLAGPGLPGSPDPNLPDPNTFYRNYVGTITLGLADSTAYANPDGFGLGGNLGDLLGGPALGGGDLQGSGSGTASQPTFGGSQASVPSFSAVSPSTSIETAPGSGNADAPAVAAPSGSVPPAALADPGLEALASSVLAADSDVARQLSRFYAASGLAALAAFALSRARRLVWN